MKVGIIVPRYGENIVGGAETLARTLAEYLASQNWQVTVLTSCAQNHHTWESYFDAGKTVMNDVALLRFPVARWDATEFHKLNNLLGDKFFITLTEQFRWLASGIHAPSLYHYLATNQADFDYIFALPYLSTIVQYAAWVAPEKTFLIPCLHNEAHAYTKPLHALMESVCGVLFLTPEERDFALQTLQLNLPNTAVIGMGLNTPPEHLPQIPISDTPTLIAISRLEPTKNLALLYEYVQRYVDEGGQLKLQLMGTGSFLPPEHPAFEQLGFLPQSEKLAYIKSSLAVCQPSLMESFSIVIMESWQMGRPVLVHKECAVTSGHVQRSNGGIAFASYQEFASAIDRLQSHPDEAQQMGANGAQYVNDHYRWPLIFEKLTTALGK